MSLTFTTSRSLKVVERPFQWGGERNDGGGFPLAEPREWPKLAI
jgi:hypothetical protein